ncbi:MAG: FUSC family membrane protein [Niabella sp.]
MNYIYEYRRFVNSYYFNEALRMTIGITLPAIVFHFLGMLPVGLTISLGAMAVSGSDIPGPIHRRRNGMLVTLALVFLVSLITGLANMHPILLGFVIAILCFSLSYLGIYGTRVNAVGFSGILIMVLSLDGHHNHQHLLYNSLLILAGGSWYLLLSLALFGIRPYRIIQQALGDNIISISEYLKIRSRFYDEQVDYDKTYKALMHQHQQIQDQQNLLRDMLYTSRSIIRQSTIVSRTLLIIFIESIDLFEKATATFYNYQSMHKRFDGADILPRFQKIILEMVDELHEIGLAVQSGRPSPASKKLNDDLNLLKIYFEDFLNKHRQPDTIEPLLNMRKIMQSIEEMTIRIYTLHHYTRYDERKTKDYALSDSYDPFITRTELDPRLLWENLSLRSNNFRHALRVSFATTLGYVVSIIMKLDFSYWVLLTIIVILKPTYSLSKQRNYQRLLGTIIGATLGIGLIYIIHSNTWIFVSMMLLMLLTYSFIRTKYLIAVIFMTGYMLIFFFLINTNNFYDVFKNRVIDTAVGCVIAFLSAYIFIPNWEKKQIKTYMTTALEKATHFFEAVSQAFVSGTVDDLAFRLSRKDAFIEQANLSGGFTRMLNEPKNKQANNKEIHQFVVLVHTLNSHIVTLADFARKYAEKYHEPDFGHIADDIAGELLLSINLLTAQEENTYKTSGAILELRQEMKELVSKRNLELQQGLMDTETRTTFRELKPIADQFLFISSIAADIKKVATALQDV